MTALVVGCGFLGSEIARRLAAGGADVTGITRSPEPAEHSVRRAACDITDPASLEQNASLFAAADALVFCVSSGRGGPEAYRRIHLEGLGNVLAAAPRARLVFTSSTSVYGQTSGEWVDESAPAEPLRETGRILLAAEQRALAHGGFAARLTGLYGPGRSVYLRKFLDGTARVEGDGGRWINQVHRDDAAGAVVHLLTSGVAPGIYNVCDDSPMTQRAVYELLAAHFDRPAPPSGPVDLDRKRGWTSKRVSNARLRATGWTCRFPSFRDALAGLDAQL